MFTIVGLGNPGEEHKNTRHNIGWITLEHFLHAYNLPSFSKSSTFSALLSEGTLLNTPVTILFPTTFMNNSGVTVAKYIKERSSLQELVVVHDEIGLALGDVKISFDRGAGGHNGVKSIIDECGGTGFTRIRVGIAHRGFFGGIKRPIGERLAEYVLGTFKSGEEKLLPEVIQKVDTALELILTKGVESAMQEINKS